MKVILCPEAFGNVPCPIQKENTIVKFVLEIKDAAFLQHADTLAVRYIRDDWRMDDDRVSFYTRDCANFWQMIPFTITGNTLTFEANFKGEFEHYIRINVSNGETLWQAEYFFYSLKEDLYELDVYKGNVHTHSTGSDGILAPEEVPFHMRKAGFDFTAVTDHKIYDPTLKAVESNAAFDSGLIVYPGEEAESYGVGINHILSIGCPASVSAWEYDETSDFAARVKKVEEELLAEGYPPHEAKYAGQFEAITSKIREMGGISVLCHPYWKQNARYASTVLLTDILLKRENFDAIELGNYPVPRTALCNAKIMEAIRNGFDTPFIGSSEYHGNPKQEPRKDYTFIFAKGADFASFRDAVKNSRCVAVGGTADEFPFGPFRLVKYINFLMEHYFSKIHDPLCAEQGELLLRAYRGEEGLLPRITAIKKELEETRKEFFGKK